MPSPDQMTASAESAFRRELDAAIDAFVQARRGAFEPLGSDVLEFVATAARFVSGGKALRASFCRAGWLAAGGVDADPVMVEAAAAIELLQGSALVHDDLMDGSDTRRGRPSVHREFEARHRDSDRVGDPAWYGQSAAVLMGDLLLSWSNEMLVAAALRADPAAARTAIEVFDSCKAEVAAGQFMDVTAQTRAEISVADAMVVVRYKSAKYTVERPLQIGAALAGADAAVLAQLSEVALPLGEAFQLRDDVLGVFGDPEVTGKPAGDDLREGKRTVLVARALELTDAAGRAAVLEGLGTDAIDAVRAVIHDSGALAAVESDIARLEATADAAIDALGARDVLGPLALRATRRDR